METLKYTIIKSKEQYDFNKEHKFYTGYFLMHDLNITGVNRQSTLTMNCLITFQYSHPQKTPGIHLRKSLKQLRVKLVHLSPHLLQQICISTDSRQHYRIIRPPENLVLQSVVSNTSTCSMTIIPDHLQNLLHFSRITSQIRQVRINTSILCRHLQNRIAVLPGQRTKVSQIQLQTT